MNEVYTKENLRIRRHVRGLNVLYSIEFCDKGEWRNVCSELTISYKPVKEAFLCMLKNNNDYIYLDDLEGEE